MHIENSLDWAEVHTNLKTTIQSKIVDAENRRQLFKMLNNIDNQISFLSRAEVLARRGKGSDAIILLEKINQDIESIEEFMLIATLIG